MKDLEANSISDRQELPEQRTTVRAEAALVLLDAAGAVAQREALVGELRDGHVGHAVDALRVARVVERLGARGPLLRRLRRHDGRRPARRARAGV